MANTVIQLKWSDVTSAPVTLNVGEAAYSNTSHKLYIGDTSNNVLTIGGKYFTDQQGLIFTKTNSAFSAANSAGSYANSAFDYANSLSGGAATDGWARAIANSAASYANSAFSTANSASSAASSAQGTADGAASAASAAQSTADSAALYANGAFAAANSGGSAASYANSAFSRANNSINANTGGQITGDLSITGNLSVTGNLFSVSASQIVANDTLFILGTGNYTADILDIGFASHYNDGANAHTGLIRDAGTKEWQLFEGYTPEITANNNIDINDPSFKIGTLNANLHSTVVLVKGIDLLPYVNNAYAAANTADAKATSAGSYANSAFLQANTPSHVANSASAYANAAFAAANTSASAGSYANSGFAVANSAASYANAAFNVANGASFTANTDYTNLTITAGDYGTGSAVASFKVEANGRISSANNTAIAIAAGAITSGTLDVARGGTGAGTFTTNGVLLGQGTSAFTTASSSTEGHVLTINASGVPTFSYIQGGTF